ncbi:MAG: hypothetical protein QM704_24445 [Anaeromyxobacteraceae bacterium]
MRRIGDMLLARNACTLEGLHAALENQVLFGGRLGTNLIEAGAVREEDLAEVLGAKYGVPWLAGDDLTPDPAALALVPADLADRCNAVPYRVEGRRLTVCCIEPGALGLLDEISFVSGKQVAPAVVTETRLAHLLRAHYRVDRHLRAVAMRSGILRPRAPSEAPGAARAPRARAFDAVTGQVVDQDGPALLGLAGEDEEPVVAPPAGRALVDAPTPPLPGGVPALDLSGPGEAEDAPLEGEPVEAPPPRGRPEPPPLELPSFTRDLLAKLALDRGEPPAVPVRPGEPPAEWPVDLQVSLTAMAAARDREAVLGILLRHAAGRFYRTVLFRLDNGLACAIDGRAPGVGAEALRTLLLPLGDPGIVSAAVLHGMTVDGPLAHVEADWKLVQAIGGGPPLGGVAVPILCDGRIVNVLYADRGPGGAHDRASADDLGKVAEAAGRRYDQLPGRE